MKPKTSKIQVSNEHYSPNYDLGSRFLSYREQLKLITKLEPSHILDVGGGRGFLKNYLINQGFKAQTADIDPELKPDYLSDIRDLKKINKQFDVVCAFQVLEHIPFKDFEEGLKNLKQISNKYVLVSLPYSCASLSFNINFRAGPIKFKKTFLLAFPFFFHTIDIKKNKQHYWEIGTKNHSRKKIRKIIKQYFKIKKEYILKENPYHIFYVLKK